MIEASVRRNPDATALVDAELSLTYAQLDARAEAVARRLRGLGAGPGTIVGLVARRRADTIAALLGVLRAGAAYCPLDPAYPLERLRFMLEDSGAAALLAGREDAETFADPRRPTLLLDDSADAAPFRSEAAAREAGPSDLAYVMYTSGSTGKPKGVMVELASAAGLVRAMMRIQAIGPGDRTLLFSSMSFDASVGEIFPCLCAGATMFLRGETVPPAREFIRSLEEMRISTLFLPTAYWHELAATPAPLRAALPACLRSVVVGGEAMRAESLDYWRPAADRVRLFNVYGPTEATVWASVYDVPADAPSSGIVPIGRPAAAAALHVIGPDGAPVPNGSAGELWIGGPGVARGYLNRPELTAERFLPDAFSGRREARLYRTGDRVRRRPDGMLEFLGRFDDQVKIRGFRVELGEVEAALASHPAVGTCAAVLREESSGVQRLVAYVSPGAGAPASASALRAFLLEKLPEYMVPAAIVEMPVLPLTPAGKIDRRALPSPPAAPATEATETAGPRALTPLERQIRGVMEEVLGVSPIGLRDDFYSLGGHSILAVRLMAKLEKSIGRRPPLTALSKGTTIERLAEAMGVWSEDRPFVRFGPEAGDDPIFFVHPGLGFRYCQELSRAMPTRPFYVLVPHNLAGPGRVPTIEEMARRHVETIRTIRPRGPYRLGGYCSGSTIAYEMACQLAAAGERVPRLMLVAVPNDCSWWRLVRRVVGHIGPSLGQDQTAMLNRFNLLGKSGELVAGMFQRDGAARLREAFRQALSRVKKHRSIRAFGPNSPDSDDNQKAVDWAWAAYRPGPYLGAVTLFEAREDFAPGRKSELRSRASSSAQVWLPGDHYAITKVYAAELGAEIARRLS